MNSGTARASTRRGTRRAPASLARPEPAPGLWSWRVWLLVCLVVAGFSVWFVQWSYLRPSFDPFGWLTWAEVLLRGARLNLNAAPSWKPLPFLFTLPYSLLGRVSVQIWSVTATAGTLLMGVFAGRSVYRLTGAGRHSGRWAIVAAWIGSVVAAAGVLGMEGVPELTYIANSDGLNTALLLAAVDAHLCRRYRLAYVALLLAALGRPEAWFMIGVYGIWMAWRVPGNRAFVLAGWMLILLAWFVPDAIWAKSITQAGALDMGKPKACHITRIVCVPSRWADLYEWPMQLAALLGVLLAMLRRDRRILVLFGFALWWVLVEIAFALHGFSAVPRYLMEPAAVMIVIAGWGIEQLLAAGRAPADQGRRGRRPAAALGPLLALGIVIALLPFADHRVQRWRIGYSTAHAYGVINRNLLSAVERLGGRAAVVRCGVPAALNQYQSQLAWALGVNVASILFDPPRLLHAGRDIVLFTRQGFGWRIHAYNVAAARAGSCARRLDQTIS